MLILDHVTKHYGEKTAVDDVSFSVAPGEVFSLIGSNGSGKTTLLKMVVGLLRPDQGIISVNQDDTVEEPLKTKSLIGYIPDEPAAWPGMTGEEFLHFVGALYGVDENRRKRKIRELLPLFRIDGSEMDDFDGYSRGNKQKFSILAALLHEPKLLLIDEPIVGLDPESALVAKDIFTGFAERGGSVLLVTHTLPVAETISDRIGILKHGKLIATGNLTDIRKRAHQDPSASLETLYNIITA
jgi:ABC-2 type transport system ATP-binding protein